MHAVGLVRARPLKNDELLVRQSIGRRRQGIVSCFVVRYVSGTILVVDVTLQEVTAAIEGRDRRSLVSTSDVGCLGAAKAMSH